VFIATQLNSTRQREQQLTQFVGRDVINKNTTDLAVRCSTGSVEFSRVKLCRYKHPFKQFKSYRVDKQTHPETDTTENETTFPTLPLRRLANSWRSTTGCSGYNNRDDTAIDR